MSAPRSRSLVRVLLSLSAFVVLSASSCPNNLPPTPSAGRTEDGSFAFVDLLAILKQGGPITNVGRSPDGNFAILGPGRRGTCAIDVLAPWPSTFEVRVGGQLLAEAPQTQGDPPGADAGYWRKELTSSSSQPGRYRITVVPPLATMATASTVQISLRNVSVNPAFAGDTNPQHVSQTPIVVTLEQQISHVVTVTVLTKNGTVTSEPPGLSCSGTCSFDFETVGTPNPVVLHASPSSRFVSWGGACSGSSPTCSLTMPGRAQGVSASFGSGTGSVPANACPAPAFVPGKVFVTTPVCDAHLLGGVVQCVGGHYVCCFTSSDPNHPDPTCGTGNQLAPATCPLETAPDSASAPTGCYL